MPWKETHVVEERFRFVEEYRSGIWTMSELCREFGISRKTGYKYWKRYEEQGSAGLKDRSRRPHSHGRAVDPAVEQSILALRRKHRTWGAPKLWDWLAYNRPDESWPSATTIHRILDRNGLVKHRKSRRKGVPSEDPLAHAAEPNDLWCVDFKGWFRTRDGSRCEPFTVTDAFSRFALCCRAVSSPNFENVHKWLERAFREYGLPRSMRSDNGAPFSTRSVAGLSRLALWLIDLEIRIERIDPGEPQQNGRHERFHRTLKDDTASPPAQTLNGQQRRFRRFLQMYNEERPHEALAGRPPAAVYEVSCRDYPRVIRELEYPSNFEMRKIRSNGTFKWKGEECFVSEVLRGRYVGLEPFSDRHWAVHYGPLELGVFDSEKKTLRGHKRLRYAKPISES